MNLAFFSISMSSLALILCIINLFRQNQYQNQYNEIKIEVKKRNQEAQTFLKSLNTKIDISDRKIKYHYVAYSYVPAVNINAGSFLKIGITHNGNIYILEKLYTRANIESVLKFLKLIKSSKKIDIITSSSDSNLKKFGKIVQIENIDIDKSIEYLKRKMIILKKIDSEKFQKNFSNDDLIAIFNVVAKYKKYI